MQIWVWVAGARGAGGGVRFSGVRAEPLQHSSTAGNLIGPELSPMRRSRPAVARRLSIRDPVPCPPAAREPDLVTPPLYTRDA